MPQATECCQRGLRFLVVEYGRVGGVNDFPILVLTEERGKFECRAVFFIIPFPPTIIIITVTNTPRKCSPLAVHSEDVVRFF